MLFYRKVCCLCVEVKAYVLMWCVWFARHWLGSWLWGGELKGSSSRSGLSSLGHSRYSTKYHRGRRERMGKIHRLPAFLLVKTPRPSSKLFGKGFVLNQLFKTVFLGPVCFRSLLCRVFMCAPLSTSPALKQAPDAALLWPRSSAAQMVPN